MNVCRTIVTATLVAAGIASTAGSAQATTITYSTFAGACGTTLTCVGSATSPGVLRLTPAASGQTGAAYSTTPITLGASNIFSTIFQFQFTNTGGINPADGITFVLAANPTGLGGAGGGLGYLGVANSVAIEFDTFNNGETGGSNHVAVDTNGLLNGTGVSPYGVDAPCAAVGNTVAGCMSNTHVWTVGIGYDGTTLTVTVQDGAMAVQNIISTPINIAAILGTSNAFVGFTGGTGAGFENQDILNWQFADTTELITTVPEPATLTLLGLGTMGLGFYRRRRRG